MKKIILPESLAVDRESLSDTYGKFYISPLMPGWGWTIGTAMRRILLSSIEGTAVTELRIDGVLHEFSTIEGVLEDVPLIVLNVKKLRFKMEKDEPQYIYLRAKGKGEYKAEHLELPPGIEVVNKAQKILTVTDDKKKVNVEMKVEKGRGHETADEIKKRFPAEPVGTIFLDAFYSPVRKVNVSVENTRYKDRTDFEKLIIEVWTDGTIKPQDALKEAADILLEHVNIFLGLERRDSSQKREERESLVEYLDIPDTVKKVLSEHNIKTVEDLKRISWKDIEEWGVKQRTLSALKNKFHDMGIELKEE